MTRTYDSGLAAPVRTALRNGVINLLAPLARSAGAFAQKICPFPFVIKSYVNDDYELNVLMDILDGASCALAVAVGDSKAKRAGAAGQNHGDYDVEVYAYTNHMRHLVLGRLEADARALALDTVDPGIDVMVELVRMLLTDKPVAELGAHGDVLRYDGDHHLITNREGSIWAVRFSMDIGLNTNMLRGATEFITEILARHHVGAGTPPPADPTPGQPIIRALTTP